MELQEFVEKTLTQIIAGTKKAQASARANGGNVNPAGLAGRTQPVEFDVALTSSDASGGQGGIGVFFGPVALGGRTDSKTITESCTRVKFKIFVELPQGD